MDVSFLNAHERSTIITEFGEDFAASANFAEWWQITTNRGLRLGGAVADLCEIQRQRSKQCKESPYFVKRG